MVLRICVICGIEFQTKRWNIKTCSPAHSQILRNEYLRKWREENKIETKEKPPKQRVERVRNDRHKKHRQTEKYRETRKKYLAENREHILKQGRERANKSYAENPEKHREAQQKRRAENPEKHSELQRKHYWNNPEKRRDASRLSFNKRKTCKALAEFQFQAATLAEGTNQNEHSHNRTASNVEHVQTAISQRALHAPRYLRKSRRNSANRRKQAFSRA